MRVTVFAIAVIALAVSAMAMDIGRPKLHNKLVHRRALLGNGQAVGAATSEEIAALEHLRVAAAEREESLADRFAADLAAHVEASDAVEAEADATVTETEGTAVEAEIVAEDEAEAEEEEGEEEAGAADAAAESESRLSIETLQELEFTKSQVYAPRKNALKAAARPGTLQSSEVTWSNCQVAGKKAGGAPQSTLTSVGLRAAPPARDMSLMVEIDGKYTGPDVTYGSATLQIARVSSPEPQAKDLPDLVYRHSIVLKDVLASPFTARDPLSATMYVPESVFNMYAPSGEYTMSIVFTNQDKQPFACTKIDFRLA